MVSDTLIGTTCQYVDCNGAMKKFWWHVLYCIPKAVKNPVPSIRKTGVSIVLFNTEKLVKEQSTSGVVTILIAKGWLVGSKLTPCCEVSGAQSSSQSQQIVLLMCIDSKENSHRDYFTTL